ncbi:MAG: (d)CMP kinase [Alphaproteobacteria bacterium]
MQNVIAIDGPAASGKGTAAKKLAAHLDYALLDTGKLYRAAAYLVKDAQEDDHLEAKAIEAARQLKDHADLNGVLGNPQLGSEEIARKASIISAIAQVRSILFDLQRDFALSPPALSDGSLAKGAILDGRDIGMVICPDAALKFYITASPEVRANRRFIELRDQGKQVIYDDILADVIARDERDMNRKIAPLIPAPDAVIIDSSDLTIDEVFNQILSHIG